MSAINEWSSLLHQMIEQAQEIIDMTSTTSRLQAANGIPAMIAAAQPGEYVGDSGMTKERATEILVMWNDFSRWMQNPIRDETGSIVADPPVVVLSRR